VVSALHEPSTRRATTLTLTYGTFLFSAPLVVVEKCGASKMPVAFGAAKSNVVELTRRAGHAIATRLFAELRDVDCTHFVTRVSYVLRSHGTSKFCDNVIMSFDIIVQ